MLALVFFFWINLMKSHDMNFGLDDFANHFNKFFNFGILK